MSTIATGLDKQYANSEKLAARARLVSEYMVAETPWFSWVARQLPLERGSRVLDIGCGPGWFWTGATEDVPDDLVLTLADSSQGMIDEALDRCKALPFAALEGTKADAAALPFADGAFDAVVAMHMLYHLPDPAAGIAEMFRVLKPGGFLAVTTNGAGDMRALYALTQVFGGDAVNPAAVAFGFDAAETMMRDRFGDVRMSRHPARLRITEPEDVFLALTSFPPGETADAAQKTAFRQAIADAFAKGGGVLDVPKETGLFLSVKRAG